MKQAVTIEKVDDLLQFLPLFEKPNRAFVETWGGGEKSPEGLITMPYPVYPPDVREFFRLRAQPCWSDHGYEPTAAAAMLEDDEAIRRATIEQVRTMVTYCVCGERFCDGHREAVLRSGKIVALLRGGFKFSLGGHPKPAINRHLKNRQLTDTAETLARA